MKKATSSPSTPAVLRNRAEQQLIKRKPKGSQAKIDADSQRLFQELQIHQIELEMQNEELKQAKADVEEGLERFTDLYDFAPVGYFTFSADGTIRQVNLTGSFLVGIDRSKLVGRRFGLLLPPRMRSVFSEFLGQVFATHAKQSGEFEIMRLNLPPLIVTIEARCQTEGLQCHAVVVDITERKQAEDKVLVSEIRYRRLFEAAHDGVLLLDPATRKITDANPFMTKLLGYRHDMLVGKELFEIGLLKDEAASKEMFRKLKRQRQVRYDNLPLESKSGRHQEVEVVANLYEENGHPVIQCNVRDITKRKQLEDILRRNEALFSALLAQAPFGVYVVDEQLRIIQVNPKALPIFKNIHPLIGRDFAEVHRLLWPRRVSDPIVARFRHTLLTGEPHQELGFAARRRDIGVEEVYEWQIQRVTLPSGEHRVVAFFNNITERTRAEDTRRRLEVMAASNSTLKTEIVRRQILEGALTTSEQHALMLLDQSRVLQRKMRQMSHQVLLAQENQRKEISHELHDKISQVLIGINVQLAIFTRAAAMDPHLVRRTIIPVRRLVEKSVRIVHQFARELRPAMLDELGLIPALRTYIDELPKRKGREIFFSAFSGAEGLENEKRTVLYRVAQEALTNVLKHSEAHDVRVILAKTKGGVSLEVKDDGRAFEVGKLSSARWNNRLGMIGMRERVEMVGGRFTVESAPGEGTTIRAEIPTGKTRAMK